MQNTSSVTRPLIGLQVSIIHSTNPNQVNKTGHVINESHGTVTLSTGDRILVIPKTVAVFEIVLPNGKIVQVDGKTIVGHPAERLRRAKRQRW